jgi:hypothetical protein
MDTLLIAGLIIIILVVAAILVVKIGEFFKKNERGDKILAYGCMSFVYIVTFLGVIGAIILGVNIGGKLGVLIVVAAGIFSILIIWNDVEAHKRK